MELKFNEAKTVRPNHLERCLCYDKFLKGYRCYVYDDISKYWCTQATTEHDPNGDNHIVDYADYQVTKWASLQQEQPERKKNCNDCPHCVDRKDQNGWHFKGCFGGPYKGKFIAEIDECPLKQEQPEVDLVAELKHHLETTTKEQLEKEWKELEPWNNVGPTVREFLYGKQPEVDLEKVARHVYESWMGGTMDDVRRDMVELGKVLNARKENEK